MNGRQSLSLTVPTRDTEDEATRILLPSHTCCALILVFPSLPFLPCMNPVSPVPKGGAPSSSSVPPPLPPLATPALLTFHRELLKAALALEKPIAEWRGLFVILARVASALQTMTPRYQSLIRAAQSHRGSDEENRQRQAQVAMRGATTATGDAANDGAFFNEPMPNHTPSASVGDQSDASGGDVDVDVGVLASLPGVVAQLTIHHQHQIEVAWKLLASTQSDTTSTLTRPKEAMLQPGSPGPCSFCLTISCVLSFFDSHDFSSCYSSLSSTFDHIHDLYALHKRSFTPAQLTHWCAPMATHTAASGKDGSATKKKANSASKLGSATRGGGKLIAAAAAAAGSNDKEKEEPAGNSVWNIMKRVESIEKMIQKESVISGLM